jgi:hypothetical protein
VAKHPRIICIEMSVRQEVLGDPEKFVEATEKRIRDREQVLLIDGQTAPPAYLFISNTPFHLHLDDDGAMKFLFMDGFKIPDFGSKEFPSLTAAYKAHKKHEDVISVGTAYETYTVPTTFDGEVPEIAFGQAERRFIVGDRHRMDDGFEGELEQGLVVENEKTAHLVYAASDGQRVTYTAPLTDAEMSAYRQHPETFFGKVEKVGKTLRSTLDLFAHIYESYRQTPRKRILEWVAKAPNIEELNELSDEELRLAFAEMTVVSMIQHNPPKDVRLGTRRTDP